MATADEISLAYEFRELRAKAAFYRVAAALFLVLGVILSVMIYAQKIAGHELETIRSNPLLILLLFVPILPAIFLERRLGKTRKKVAAMAAKLRTARTPAESDAGPEPAEPA